MVNSGGAGKTRGEGEVAFQVIFLVPHIPALDYSGEGSLVGTEYEGFEWRSGSWRLAFGCVRCARRSNADG